MNLNRATGVRFLSPIKLPTSIIEFGIFHECPISKGTYSKLERALIVIFQGDFCKFLDE